MSSRYATFSIPLVIAAYGLLASLSRDSSSIESRNAHAGMPKTKSLRLMWSNIRAPSVNQMSPILLCATLGIALVGAGHSFREGLREGRIEKDRRESQQPVICAIESQPDDAIGVFGNKAVVRRNAAILKRLGYSVFADSERYCRPPSIASATTGPVQATTR
jgi:hypothetical protein